MEAPAQPQGPARRLAVQVLGIGPNIPGQTLVERARENGFHVPIAEPSLSKPTSIMAAPAYVMDGPEILPSKRTSPHEKKIASGSATQPLDSQGKRPSLKLNSEISQPFLLKGELKSRKVISAPSLPKYPEWALSAAVELNLKVSLSVDANGLPYRVFIDESSGDSQTDLAVLRYVEKMRFEASLSASEGSMEWAFLLQR